MTLDQHEQEVARLLDALAAARAEIDQRTADLEAAEAATEEIPRLTAAVRLGEIDGEEAARRKAELAAAVDDGRRALEESDAEVVELERRVASSSVRDRAPQGGFGPAPSPAS